MNIALDSISAKLPMEEITRTIWNHIRPRMNAMPDKRRRNVLVRMVLGILGGQTPVITEMARQSSKEEGETWAVAKRIYRLLGNKRLENGLVYGGLYAIGQEVVAEEAPDHLIVAMDPMNFEKPYAESIEGVSMIHKATPPDLRIAISLATDMDNELHTNRVTFTTLIIGRPTERCVICFFTTAQTISRTCVVTQRRFQQLTLLARIQYLNAELQHSQSSRPGQTRPVWDQNRQ